MLPEPVPHESDPQSYPLSTGQKIAVRVTVAKLCFDRCFPNARLRDGIARGSLREPFCPQSLQQHCFAPSLALACLS